MDFEEMFGECPQNVLGFWGYPDHCPGWETELPWCWSALRVLF